MKTFHQLLASDPNVAPAFSSLYDDRVECDWDGCLTGCPITRNGLQFAPSCLPAYEADQEEQEAIDLEDTERRLSRAFDAVAYPEDPGRHFRNIQIARMKRKQAARETGAEHRIEDVA